MEKQEIIKEAIAAGKEGNLTITILEGKAPEFLKPVEPIVEEALTLRGQIGTISEFLKKRAPLFEPNECNIRVDLQDAKICFVGNECCKDGKLATVIDSKAVLREDFATLEINTGKAFTAKELAKYLRTRKIMFREPEQFTKIWHALSNLKAQVDKEIEIADDRSGNATNAIRQKVAHNIPKSFTLFVQPFDNHPKVSIDIEVDIDPDELLCSLISYEKDSIVESIKMDLIDAELDTEIDDGLKLRYFCVTYFA